MNANFWLERWQSARIGFHRLQVNAQLKQYWPIQTLASNASVLVPLCGKSIDMLWLAEQGHLVTGFELSPVAITDFYAEARLSPTQQEVGPYHYWQAGRLGVYQGDFFKAGELALRFASAYDRAALIALPAHMRNDYVRLLADLLHPGAVLLLITVHYAPDHQQGPPFSISESSVRELFEPYFSIEHIATVAEGPAHPRVAKGELRFFDELCFVLKRKEHP